MSRRPQRAADAAEEPEDSEASEAGDEAEAAVATAASEANPPTDLASLERMAIRQSSGSQEIATMRQPLELATRELMKDNRINMVCITYIHEDGTGINSAILRPPAPGTVQNTPEWQSWEAGRRAALMHGSTYLKTGHDTLSRMALDAMQKGI